jgi:hypothetical protein
MDDGANSPFGFSSSMFVQVFGGMFFFFRVWVILQLLLQLNEDLGPKHGRANVICDNIAFNVVLPTNRT